MSRRTDSPSSERPPLYGRSSPRSLLEVISPASPSSHTGMHASDQDARNRQLPVDPMYLHPDVLVPDDHSMESTLTNEWSPVARAPIYRTGARGSPGSSSLSVPSLNSRAVAAMYPSPCLNPGLYPFEYPGQGPYRYAYRYPPPPPPHPLANAHRVQRFREMGFISPVFGDFDLSDDDNDVNHDESRLDDVQLQEEQDESRRVSSLSDTSLSEDVQCELGGIVGALAKVFRYFNSSRSHSDSAPRDLLEQCMICPIRQEIMWDPVVDPDGHSYEKEAIVEWLSIHSTSPITRRPLRAQDLRPNRALQAVIHQYMKARPSPDAHESTA